MKTRAVQIPPLAFGHRPRTEFRDPARMAEAMAAQSRTSLVYHPLDVDTPFLGRSAMVQTRIARVVASASSALEGHVETPSSVGAVLIPLHGGTVRSFQGRDVEWDRETGPVFLPSDRCSFRTTARSVVSIDMDPAVIDAILRAMLGEADQPTPSFAIDLRTPRLLHWRAGSGADLGHEILRHVAFFDELDCAPHLIERTGLDDTILRTAILMLYPQLLRVDSERQDRSRTALNLACDYIDAHLAERVTLTDLERVTGLSARRLQYAFRAAYARSPMQWLSLRRLEAVRQRILTGEGDQKLTTIASDYFGNLGDFARLYRQRYGERPSETLQRVRARRLRS